MAGDARPITTTFSYITFPPLRLALLQFSPAVPSSLYQLLQCSTTTIPPLLTRSIPPPIRPSPPTSMSRPIQIRLTTTPPCHTPLSLRPPPCPPDPSVRHSCHSHPFMLIAFASTAHQPIPAQYPYPPYPTQSPPADHRSYYATSSQAPAIEHYPSPGSPTGSYATLNPSAHLSPQPSRHHAHLSQQQQQQFIPTPVQTFQGYPSAASNSSARSRSSIEPYYHMSPNPQHVVHAPTASTTHAASATGGRSSTAHGPGSSHSHHPHVNTHTSTIVVTAGERYPCDLCDRSFTRLHDRRRHYETVHATSPVLHKCRFCRKDFSRADSLKRHIDNGCDEMPR